MDINPFSSFGLNKLSINEEFGCWLWGTKYWTVSVLHLKKPSHQCAFIIYHYTAC